MKHQMSKPAQMKPIGTWEVRRRIKIPALGHPADAIAVKHMLGSLSGVRTVAVDIEKRQTTVLYDATVLDYQSIGEGLENMGFPPLNTWWTRFKAGCYQYSDTNARENAHARPSACCNKPPK